MGDTVETHVERRTRPDRVTVIAYRLNQAPRVGDTVLHPKYGEGSTLDLRLANGALEARIDFGRRGIKWLSTPHALLAVRPRPTAS